MHGPLKEECENSADNIERHYTNTVILYSKCKSNPRKSTVYTDFGDCLLLLPLGKAFITSNTLVNAISSIVFIIFVLYLFF